MDLEKAIGLEFKEPSLLQQALVHSSYVNENPALPFTSYERLEFLGDAVLGLIVAEKLYQDFHELSEGEMTRLRAAVVRRETLADFARALGLGTYLYLGKGEEASGGRDKMVNLAGTMEAVIAAIYLDQGLAAAREFVLKLVDEELRKVIGRDKGIDYKSRLQELFQSRQKVTPAYRPVNETGPEHRRVFTVEVLAGDEVLGRGSGRSKKQAETEAARDALEKAGESFTG